MVVELKIIIIFHYFFAAYLFGSCPSQAFCMSPMRRRIYRSAPTRSPYESSLKNVNKISFLFTSLIRVMMKYAKWREKIQKTKLLSKQKLLHTTTYIRIILQQIMNYFFDEIRQNILSFILTLTVMKSYIKNVTNYYYY